MTYIGESPAQITVDSFTLNATDDVECDWIFDDIDGWHDGPGVEVEQSQRVSSHGQFAQLGRRTGRAITVSGSVSGDTRAPVAAAVRRLATILADGGFDTFTVTDDEDGTLWTSVQLLDRPQIAWDNKLAARFQLQFLAPDAYRYGTTSTAATPLAADAVGSGLVFDLFPSPSTLDFGASATPGSVTISNPGTADASVKFTVAGPTPDAGFMITDLSTGKTIKYLGSVPSGSSLVLDGSDGSVIIDGTADRLGDTIVEAWPVVAAGTSRDFLFTTLGASSAAVMTATCVATYW